MTYSTCGDAMFDRQCRLQKGNTVQMSWIPEPYCVKGKVLKLREEDGTWSDGWLVVEAHSRRDERLLPDLHKEIRGHRKATGDSLPRTK